MAEPRDSFRMLALARLMVGAVMLWALWLTYRHRHHHAGGTVIVDGTPFAVDACKKIPVDGPDEHSIGADLSSPEGKVLRVVRKGDVVELWLFAKSPGGAAIPINQSDCSEWKVALSWDDPGPSRADSGHMSLTCRVGGHKLNGLAYFDDCPAK